MGLEGSKSLELSDSSTSLFDEKAENSKKIAIIGSEGTIGRIASIGLDKLGHDIVNIDIDPSVKNSNGYRLDLSKMYDSSTLENNVKSALAGCDAILNYGWNASKENFTLTNSVPENRSLAENVYQLAHEEEIPLVIQASSIHAGSLPAYASVKDKKSVDEMLEMTEEPYRTIIDERISNPSTTLSVDRISPDSPYGATKIDIESLGEYHANTSIHNRNTTHYDSPLETVVAIRYGGINPKNEVASFLEEEPLYDTIWMSHQDAVRQLNSILESEETGFHRVYGLSNNDGNPYSTENPFGFEPQNNAAHKL